MGKLVGVENILKKVLKGFQIQNFSTFKDFPRTNVGSLTFFVCTGILVIFAKMIQ